jgi:predicted small secreted protein
MLMKKRDLLIGFSTGVAAGFLIREVAHRIEPTKPAELVLHGIKQSFKEEGPIDGSWIYMKTEPFNRQAVSTDVYRGGISRVREGEFEQFEFFADSRTGTVVDLIKL